MRISALSLVLSLSIFGSVHSAKADILVPNSTYDVFLDNGGTFQGYTVTVGTPQAFTFGAASGTISETQSILATGQSQLVFTVDANSELFTVTGGVGEIGVGVFNPLDLTAPFDLGSAILTFSASGQTIASGDFIASVTGPNPFNGFFPFSHGVAGYLNAGDLGVDEVQLTLTSAAAPTPEPSSLALLATGVAALGGFARRRLSH